jgi:hypothetical protein
MLEEICGIINGEVPREGLCTTADGVRFLRDRYRELREVKLELREVKRERDEAREAAAKWEAIALREASINGSRIFGEEDAK